MSNIVLSGLTTITTISLFDGWENLADVFQDVKKVGCWIHHQLPDNRFVKIVVYGFGSLVFLRSVPFLLRRTSFFSYYEEQILFFHRSNSYPQIMDVKQDLLKELKKEDHGLPLFQDNLVILELNVGGATNLSYYPQGCHLIGTDIFEENQECFENNFLLTEERVPVSRFVNTVPEKLNCIPDNSVSCVVSFHSLCTARYGSFALNEIRRVLMPGGKLYFIEHCVTRPEERFSKQWFVQLNFRPTLFLISCCVKDVGGMLDAAGFSEVFHKRFNLEKKDLHGPMLALVPHIYGYARK